MPMEINEFFMKIGQMDFAAKSFPIISITLCLDEKVFSQETFKFSFPLIQTLTKLKSAKSKLNFNRKLFLELHFQFAM